MRQRFGEGIPLDETEISPAMTFDTNVPETVAER